MEPLRKAMGMDFPNNFEYRQGGDAHLTLELLHRILNETGHSDALDRTFVTHYVVSSKLEGDDMDIETYESKYFTLPMYDLIPIIETNAVENPDICKEILRGKIIGTKEDLNLIKLIYSLDNDKTKRVKID